MSELNSASFVLGFIFFALFMIWLIKKCDTISENYEILSENARDKLINLKKELRWGSVIITLIETYFSFVLDTFKFFKKV